MLYPTLACAILLASTAYAETFTAQVFDEGRHHQLYTLTLNEGTQNGVLHRDAVYKAPDGTIPVHETADLENGIFKKYTVDYPTRSQNGVVERSGGKLQFTYTEDGKAKKDSEGFKENTIVPPITADFIVKNWDKIAKGDSVDARFASADRRETVGFEFRKLADETVDGKPATLIQMKASSFIIAAIVSPMKFLFDPQSKRLLEFRGRILPKTKDGKDQDGVIVYHYEAAH